MRSLVASLFCAALGLGACAEAPEATPEAESDVRPNDGMLRDFVDGKFDAAGHPLNAKVVTAAQLSADVSCGTVRNGAVQLRNGCRVELPAGADGGNLVV